MRLFIIRHAKAVEREQWSGSDEERPLIAEGVAQATGDFRRLGVLSRVEEIWSSPFKRAIDTARILAVQWDLPLHVQPWLAAAASAPASWPARLPAERTVALVGHEPELGQAIAVLIGANQPLAMKKGGVACLEGAPEAGGMSLRWLVTPRLLAGLDHGG